MTKFTSWAGAIALALSFPTHAAESRSGMVEEIIVTAQKREESIQDVPIAVTAVDALTLERAGVKDLRDLSSVAATFNMNSSQTESQGTTLRIRGVGTTGNNIGLESAVGVFLDGVYLSRPGVALGDLLDVEQIEVLRGPQGTLFGRNTSAGALNIRTRKPNMDENEFFANLTAGNFDFYNVQAGVSGPIADNVAYRLSGAVRQQDGYLTSTTGGTTMDRDRWMMRGQLLWEFSDTADLRIIADYADADEHCCDAVVIRESAAVAAGSFTAAGLPADGGVQSSGFDKLDKRKSNAEEFENPYEQKGISAEFNMDLTDDITLTYIGAWRDFDAESVQYSDFVNLDIFSVRPEVANGFETYDAIETWTHELRVAGDSERLTWMVGAYYSDEDIVEHQGLGLGADYTANMDAVLWNFAFAPVLGAAPGLAATVLPTGGTFGDVLAAGNQALAFAGGADANGSYAQNVFSQEGRSWSLFTHNTLHITDALDLVVGLRWTDEEKDGSFTQLEASNQSCLNTLANAGALIAAGAGGPLATVANTIGNFSAGFACFPFASPALGVSILPDEFDNKFEDDELVYTGKVVYAFTDFVSGYVSFTHGFKAGGFNLDSTAAVAGADPRFDSELIDAWEIGVKSDLFDGRLRANAAVFDYEMEDFQVLEFTGVQFKTFNVPNVEATGAELELQAFPFEWLQVDFSYAYSDAEYPSDCNNNQPTPTSVATLCGFSLSNSPENVVTFGLTHEGSIGDGLTYFLSSHSRWEDERRTSTQPDNPALNSNWPLQVQSDNLKINLRAGLGNAEGTWMVELWGNNITDRQTRNVTFNVPLRPSVGGSARGSFIEAPRTYGITLRTML